jgi:hypothetical protein
MSRAKKITEIAKSYLGIKEKPGNLGWANAEFETKMKKAGWYSTAPWCAFFTKLIWLEAYADHAALKQIINVWFNGGARLTLENAKKNGTFATGTVPKPGAIVIWLKGKGPSGHAGIVMSVNGNTMTTIEGNTNAAGSREGDQVAEKLRTVTRNYQAEGLNIAGFIYPFEV